MSEIDHWLNCPMCGSPKARLDLQPPAIFAYCPECNDMDMAEYPDIAIEYQHEQSRSDTDPVLHLGARLVGAVKDTKELDEIRRIHER